MAMSEEMKQQRHAEKIHEHSAVPPAPTFTAWWDANEKQFTSDSCHMSEYHMASVVWEAAQSAKPPMLDRLMLLLAHAVKEADGWHDDGRGGPIEDDPLIDEARALVAGVPPAPTLDDLPAPWSAAKEARLNIPALLVGHMSSDSLESLHNHLKKTRKRIFPLGLNGRTYVLSRKDAISLVVCEKMTRAQ